MALNLMYEYSNWLFNRYVEAIAGEPQWRRSAEYALVMEEALKMHLENNLQGKNLGFARRLTKERLREIAHHRRDPLKYPLAYVGSDAKKLTDRDRHEEQLKWERWEQMQDQTISIIADATEVKALKVVAKIIRSFDQLSTLKMTTQTDAYACGAANNLLKIFEIEGYEINKTKNQIIKKQRS